MHFAPMNEISKPKWDREPIQTITLNQSAKVFQKHTKKGALIGDKVAAVN